MAKIECSHQQRRRYIVCHLACSGGLSALLPQCRAVYAGALVGAYLLFAIKVVGNGRKPRFCG